MAGCAEDLDRSIPVSYSIVSNGGDEEVRTSHTSGLGGFCGPGGLVVEGRCSLGSREADDEGDGGFAVFGEEF